MLWRNSDGAIIRGTDGKLTDCDECPCCPTSGTVDVIFPGISICGCLMAASEAGQAITVQSGLGGILKTLTWDAGSLQFRLTGFGSYTRTTYTGTDCSGAVSSESTGTFTAVAYCSGGKWGVTGTGVDDIGPFTFVFFQTASVDRKPFGNSIPNELSCDGSTLMIATSATVQHS